MRQASSTLIGAMVLCLIALGFCLYLSTQSLIGDAVAGCGSGSGCGDVLASKWSAIGPVPVSALGAMAYLAVLFALLKRWFSDVPGRFNDTFLIASIAGIVVAVGWYLFLQFAVIKAFCPYCLASHVAGLFLVVFLFALIQGRKRVKAVTPSVVGTLAAAALIVAQFAIPAQHETARAPNPFADEDGDQWIDDARYVSLFGGELQFVLQDVPHIGDPSADQVVAVLFDYACPHCKTLHDMLEQAIKQDPSRFVLVPIPLSIHENHNQTIASDDSRFEDSFDRAMLSLAVATIDQAKWKQFDRWLFAMDGGDFPRSATDAQAKAEELVSADALGKQLVGDRRDQRIAQVQRNIDLISLLPEDRRFIPITTTPGAPEHLTERFDDIAVLYTLLESVDTGAE